MKIIPLKWRYNVQTIEPWSRKRDVNVFFLFVLSQGDFLVVIQNFAKVTGKHQWQSLFSDK